ncbi:hypothetical protein [Arthrobacter cryoconiti]|uniref:Uncharacterized protein n=1 Tax=Arthrobacter cryoconiti TaxID=748907 RepID=A0ABV8R0C0_9MICC|nr:hypothetical protein [Arthrobacter cryoconiti]MCC9069279.1 hypothetical protein [Arthrobacter cryoconiti]
MSVRTKGRVGASITGLHIASAIVLAIATIVVSGYMLVAVVGMSFVGDAPRYANTNSGMIEFGIGSCLAVAVGMPFVTLIAATLASPKYHLGLLTGWGCFVLQIVLFFIAGSFFSAGAGSPSQTSLAASKHQAVRTSPALTGAPATIVAPRCRG